MAPQQLHFFGLKGPDRENLNKSGFTLPLDLAILLSAGIIILLVISFSWGVRRGRDTAETVSELKLSRLTVENENLKAQLKAAMSSQAAAENNQQPLELAKSEISYPNQLEPESTAPINNPQNHPTSKTAYKIQVASFRTLSSAEKEASRLKDQGYPVIARQSGRFFVVYAGRFYDKVEAEEALRRLKAVYHDCILREFN